MNKKLNFITIGLLIASITSCQFFKTDDAVDKTVVARVNNTYLTIADIEDIIPNDASQKDSMLIAGNYIQKWIKEQLVLEKAEQNLKDEQRNFEKQIDEYRKNLTIYSYENQLINEILDTNVTVEEIAAFYEQNSSIFVLKNDIVKVRYLKVNKNAPNIKKVQRYYVSNKVDDKEKLKEYAHQFAEKFHLNEDEWVLFDEVKKAIPSTSLDREFLKNNNHTMIEDSTSVFFVYFVDYKLEKNVSPLSFEMENIKNMIINKRKIKLLNQLKNDLYEQALINKDFEIYDTSAQKN